MSSWTQADVDALQAALKGGVLSVRYDGPPAREVVYQSLPQMRALLAEMRQAVGAAAGRKPYRLASTRKGFGP